VGWLAGEVITDGRMEGAWGSHHPVMDGTDTREKTSLSLTIACSDYKLFYEIYILFI